MSEVNAKGGVAFTGDIEITEEQITIPWDGKVLTVSAEVATVIKLKTRPRAGLTMWSVKQVAKVYKSRQVELQQLYVYALFRGDFRASELTWLSQQIGGNQVRAICTAASKARKQLGPGGMKQLGTAA